VSSGVSVSPSFRAVSLTATVQSHSHRVLTLQHRVWKCSVDGPADRGGATVLKVGWGREQKNFFDPPLFGQWGGGKILLR